MLEAPKKVASEEEVPVALPKIPEPLPSEGIIVKAVLLTVIPNVCFKKKKNCSLFPILVLVICSLHILDYTNLCFLSLLLQFVMRE